MFRSASRHASSVAALITLGLCALVGAADDDPRIERILPDHALPGTLVQCLGDNLPTNAEDVAIVISGRPCTIISVSAKRIGFVVPSTAFVGSVVVEVRLRDTRVRLGLMIFQPSGKEACELVAHDFFILRQIEFDRVGGAATATVDGYARIPSDCIVQVSLGYRGVADFVIDSKEVMSSGAGRMQVFFGPYAGRSFVPGIYFVRTAVKLTPESLRSFESVGAHDLEGQVLVATDFERFGTPAEDRDRRGAFARRLMSSLSEVDAIRSELICAYAAVTRRRAADAAGLESWRRSARLDLGMNDSQLVAAEEDKRFLDNPPREWADWLSTAVWKPLTRIRERLDADRLERVGCPDSVGELMLIDGIAILGRLAKRLSSVVVADDDVGAVPIPDTILRGTERGDDTLDGFIRMRERLRSRIAKYLRSGD